jgi:hypothetical protein
MAEKLKVRLNSVVKKIDYSRKNDILIELEEG